MLTLPFAIAAAVSYGLSDYVGGRASERIDARVVALISQACAAVLAVLLVVSPVGQGAPTGADVLWGAGAGLGSAIGNVLIYRGIATSSVTSVAPMSGVVAVTIPVVVGVAFGGLPTPLQTAGLIAVVPAIWLVAAGGRSAADRRGLLIGAGAGAGFGTQFTCLGQTSEAAGLVPLAIGQGVSVALLAVLAVGVLRTGGSLPRRAVGMAAVAGVLAGVATVSYQIAAQLGDLAIAAAVTSLYPAVTVVAAAIVTRRWWTRTEGIGLALCTLALVLIST
ncbi:EamA family transporter [Microbacterium sp. JZ37]|uniref:EamA family transporter n=1 Tax=Microbacterium sp. JZ37 TaxID=2654193 RepID=UPI002B476FCA|nr:EamA family transporter [Microbacterium sp. JZ37]WRH18235.1 EamA family transporter [Microbacterium sp. JZ37]